VLFYCAYFKAWQWLRLFLYLPIARIAGGETMLESDKYAYVNIGGGTQSVYIRIKKDIPMPEPEKAKLTAWANRNGFTVSRRKRLLHAE